MSPLRRRVDWDSLTGEFLAFDGSVAKFRIHKKISDKSQFYKFARDNKWKEQKREIAHKAVELSKEGITKSMAARWVRYRELIDRCLVQLEKVAGNKKPTANQMAQLGNALDKFIKADSFLHGGPTERVEDKRSVTHADLVEIIHAVQAKDPRFIHPETIEAEVVEECPTKEP